MDITQISTDLINLAGLGDDDIKQEVAPQIKKGKPSHEAKNGQVPEQHPQATLVSVVADKATVDATPLDNGDPAKVSPDGAKPNANEKPGGYALPSMLATAYAPITGANSPAVVSPYPPVGQELVYNGQVETTKIKKKSWFGKRKSKAKNKNSKKPLKKLPPEVEAAIQQEEKRSAKSKAKDQSEIPTVIKLKKVTKPPSQLQHAKETPGVQGRDISFSDSVSTISYHGQDEGTWLEQGMSSLLNNVFGGQQKEEELADEEVRKIYSEEALLSIDDEDSDKKELKRPTWKTPVDKDTGRAEYQNPATKSTGTAPPESAEQSTPPPPSSESPAESKKSDSSKKISMKPIPEKRPAEISFDNHGKLFTISGDGNETGDGGKDDKDSESNSEHGTEKSSVRDSKLSEAGSEMSGTFEDTLGTNSTYRDGTWLEIGVTRMLDAPFSIGLGNDNDDDVFDDVEDDGDGLARQKNKSSTVRLDSITAKNNGDVEATKEKEQVMTSVKNHKESDGKPCNRSSDAIVGDSQTSSGNDGRRLGGQGVPSMMALDVESRDPLDNDPSMGRRKHANDTLNTKKAPETKSPTTSGENSNPSSRTNGVTYIQPRASLPGVPGKTKRKKRNEPVGGISLFSELYNAFSGDEEEAEPPAKESLISPSYLPRTDTGLSVITGASVFSGITGITDYMVPSPEESNVDDYQPRDSPPSPEPKVEASTALLHDDDHHSNVKKEADQVREGASANKTRHADLSPGPKPRVPMSGGLPVENEVKDDDFGTDTTKTYGEVNKAAFSISTGKIRIEPVVPARAKRQRPAWKAVVDPKSGKTYYFHRITRITTWTKPTDFEDKRKPATSWGPASIGTTKVEMISEKKGNNDAVSESLTVDSSSELQQESRASTTSFEDEDMVDIVEYKSYDPTDALQIKRSQSPRDLSFKVEEQVGVVEDSRQAVDLSRSGPSDEHFGSEFRSTSSPRSDPEQSCEDHILDDRKSFRRLLSWNRKTNAEGSKGMATTSPKIEEPVQSPNSESVEPSVPTKDESREPDVFASELLAEVEKRIDLSAANVSIDMDDKNIIVADEGFERVLSSISKMPSVPKGLSNTLRASIPDRVDEKEDVLKRDRTLMIDRASTGEVASKKHLEKNLDGDSNNDRSLRKDKGAGAVLPVSTENNRRGLLRRFKSLSKKKLGKGQATDTKATEVEATPAEKTNKVDDASLEKKAKGLKITVFAEIDTERSLDDSKVKPTKSGRSDKEIAKSKRESHTKSSTAEKDSSDQGASLGKKSAVADRTEKSSLSEKKEDSPSSVLQFVNVADDEVIVEQPKPRPVWKSVFDEASGRTYYYHRHTRQTTWTKPEGSPIEPAKPKKVSKETSDVERDSVKCNLEGRFAATETERPNVEPIQPKKKETGVSKLKRVLSRTKTSKNEKARESKATNKDMKQPIDSVYSEPTNEFDMPLPMGDAVLPSITEIDLLGTVVDSHTKASLLVRDELERVAMLFEEAKGGNNDCVGSVDDVASAAYLGTVGTGVSTAISYGNKSEEASEFPDDELSSAPADEVKGSLLATKEETTVVTKESILNTKQEEESTLNTKESTYDSILTEEKQLKHSVWEDLLFL